MKDYKTYGIAIAVLLLATIGVTGCGDAGDVTNIFPNDPTTDDGGDRVSGGSFSTGTWKASGVNADNNPFRACLNVSVDGTKLTRVGSTCTSYQNTFSIDVDGSTDCNFYYDGDVPIVNGSFSVTNFQPDARAPVLSMQGNYNNGDASGTITVDNTAWGAPAPCVAKWVAYAPGNTSTDDIIGEDPKTNTGTVLSGLWLGTGNNADGEPQYSCFFVDATGTKLTLTGSTCDDPQHQNINSFNVSIERGSNDCYVYLSNQDTIEVPIVNGHLALNNYQPNSYAPKLSFDGTITGSTASGTIKVDSQWPNGSCTAKWNVTKQ